MQRAPFSPLISGGADLRAAPTSSDALRTRMAAVYGVDEACVLPVRGAAHGIEIVLRRIALDGAKAVAFEGLAEVATLARILRLNVGGRDGVGAGMIPMASQAEVKQKLIDLGEALLLVDERYIEFSDAPSLAPLAASTERLIVLRSLEIAYGLMGAPCGALIATASMIERLADVVEPNALSTPVLRAAEAALDPMRTAAHQRQIEDVKAERRRLTQALGDAKNVDSVRDTAAPYVLIMPRVLDAAQTATRNYDVAGVWDQGIFRADVLEPAANDRTIAAFGGVAPSRARRTGEIVRETAETKIVVQVNLDATAPVSIDTGIPFYDHMLQQVAVHGGFSLSLACKGDTEVDLHHTIEDCALALGQALAQALGDRRGIGRYGFLLPMDEAEAKVSIDLGGRPYLVFEGQFDAPLLGGYPTEMTEHVFRSLAQTMGAAIHIEVKGENDHHKTEACFKGFARALRPALRIEGEAIPSSKGVL
jgi:imidazoleglycerol-phosphate dehydratase/histidinol-phosphatase